MLSQPRDRRCVATLIGKEKISHTSPHTAFWGLAEVEVDDGREGYLQENKGLKESCKEGKNKLQKPRGQWVRGRRH